MYNIIDIRQAQYAQYMLQQEYKNEGWEATVLRGIKHGFLADLLSRIFHSRVAKTAVVGSKLRENDPSA